MILTNTRLEVSLQAWPRRKCIFLAVLAWEQSDHYDQRTANHKQTPSSSGDVTGGRADDVTPEGCRLSSEEGGWGGGGHWSRLIGGRKKSKFAQILQILPCPAYVACVPSCLNEASKRSETVCEMARMTPVDENARAPAVTFFGEKLPDLPCSLFLLESAYIFLYFGPVRSLKILFSDRSALCNICITFSKGQSALRPANTT